MFEEGVFRKKSDCLNQRLNDLAANYYSLLNEKQIAEEEGEYNDMASFIECQSEFFELLYITLLYFYCKAFTVRERVMIADKGITALSDRRLAQCDADIEKVSEVYLGVLESISGNNYDPSQAFSNYFHASVAPRFKQSKERFISDEDLAEVDQIYYELESKGSFQQLRQSEIVDCLQMTWNDSHPYDKRSKAFFLDYLRDNIGTISLDLPVGEEGYDTLGDFLPSDSWTFQADEIYRLREIVELKDRLIHEAKIAYMRGKRKGKIDADEMFDLFTLSIQIESGLKLASAEERDFDGKAIQKRLAKKYGVSASAIAQEKKKLLQAYEEAWQIVMD